MPSRTPMLTLVSQGQSSYKIVYQAAIPIPPAPPATTPTKYEPHTETRFAAAQILSEYIRKSTGANLIPVQKADLSAASPGEYIFVGDSSFVRSLGVDVRLLKKDERYRMCVKGEHLILAGADEPGDPWYLTPGHGWIETPTLHAVSRFLEQYIGARWYWPGSRPVAGERLFGETYRDLRKAAIAVPKIFDHRESPSCAIRDIGLPMNFPVEKLASLGLTAWNSGEGFEKELAWRNARWLRLNRLGMRGRIWHQHYWWKLMPKCYYGTPGSNKLPTPTDKFYAFYTPPQNNDSKKYDPWDTTGRVRGGGERINAEGLDKGQVKYDNEGRPKPVYVFQNQLCVSGRSGEKEGTGEANPEIIEEMSEAIGRVLSQNPAFRSVPIVPNDGFGHCACNACLERDKFNGMVDTNAAQNRNIGRRMFWFFNQVAARVSQKYPGLILTTYAYGSYGLPPELKVAGSANPDYLEPNLVVYDTHNGTGLVYWDKWIPPDNTTHNVQQETVYRIERWGSTTRYPNGQPSGKLAIYSGIYFSGDLYVYFDRVPVSTREPIADIVGRQTFHHYLGGYYEIKGEGHWLDRYLLAKLLWSSKPRHLPLEGDESYLKLLHNKSNRIAHEYFNGLFGKTAGGYVCAFYETIGRQIQAFVQKATDNSNNRPGKPFKDTIGKAPQGAIFDKIFSPIMDTADALLTAAHQITAPDSVERAHLRLVEMHWLYTKQTASFFEYLDFYGHLPTTNTVYSADQLKRLRDFWRVMADRRETVDLINSEPNLCTLVQWPTSITNEYSSTVTTKSNVEVKMIPARRTVSTILAMQNDVVDQTWPLGANRNAMRRSLPKTYLEWSANDTVAPDDTEIEWFMSTSPSGTPKSYFAIINDSGVTKPFELRIKNLDAVMEERNLEYYNFTSASATSGEEVGLKYVRGTVPSTPSSYTWQTEHFDYSTDASRLFTESATVTDVATLNVPPVGVTVLIFSGANFAPHHQKLEILNSKYNDSIKGFAWNTLSSAYFRMFYPLDDSPLVVGSCARFYIATNETGEILTNSKKEEAIFIGHLTEGIIDSRRFGQGYNASQNLQTYIPNVDANYYVYAALYDSRGMKRVVRDESGKPFCLFLPVKKSA